MTNLIVEISRYLIILLIAIYTYYNFRFFSMKNEEDRNYACSRQLVCMFMLHFLANLLIVLNTKSEELILFYGMQVLFFVCYLSLSKFFYKKISRLLLNNICMLLGTGFIILTRLNPDRAMRQFLIVVVSAVVTWIIPFIIDRVWQLVKLAWLYGILGVLILAFVCIAGNTSFGAQLSLTVGGISVQPSEFVKISFVFFAAARLYRSTKFKDVVITTVIAALHVVILVLSRDLGSALIFFITYLFMLFVATSNWLYLGAGVMSGSAAAAAAYNLFSHVRRRVEAWRDPWADIDDKGYQVTQGLFAMGTGGWFGLGLYQGMPQKIPVVDKDFVFAAISEELGAIYALCLLFICVGCFIQFMIIAVKMQAMFYKLIAFGLGIMYITQVFLTVGGVVKFIPSTGVTLPFVSYGGSSVLATFVLFNIIQGLYILKRTEEEEYEEG
ncbi:MAG: FtsW/RodA/SpoVE family cell cycle protein [Lachnospiraceae bacterium]|nr:FtsW/RodA/SpoVE family cell cycle protein [Lachnospiraceae bacterium]MBQ2251315.1 FtsW/RodA/SpoVE family cell cycle protein [Lachnospiraceae bacterium]